MIQDTVKSRLLRGLMACLLIAGLLIPALITFSLIWQQHLELVKTQPLVASIPEPNPTLFSAKSIQLSGTTLPELACSTTARNASIASLSPLLDPHMIATTLLSIVVVMPLSFCLGIVFYRQYHLYQMTTFREQVANLEKLWRQEHF